MSKYDNLYMEMAHAVSKQSHDTKHKVGCVIVNNGQVISHGWNGMPTGMPNEMRVDGVTKREVLHSESNALMKLAKNGGSSDGAAIYCTHSPCFDCAKLLVQAGVKEIVYDKVYCIDSLRFMKMYFELRRVKYVARESNGVSS